MTRLPLTILLMTALVVNAPSWADAAVIDLGECLSQQVHEFKSYHRRTGFLDCTPLTNRLRPGDSLRFSDGQLFELEALIAKGGSVFVWSVVGRPHQVLRIPRGEQFNILAMSAFKSGWLRLKALGVPAVHIDGPDSSNLEYQLAERIPNFHFSFDEFKLAVWDHTPLALHQGARKALRIFARQTSGLAALPEGIEAGFDGNRWIFYDFHLNSLAATDNVPGRTLSTETIWSGLSVHRGDIFDELHELTLLERSYACEKALLVGNL